MTCLFVIGRSVNRREKKNHRKCDEKSLRLHAFATLAHLVEQTIRNRQVASSILAGGSIYNRGLHAKMACKPLFHVKRAFLAYFELGSENGIFRRLEVEA